MENCILCGSELGISADKQGALAPFNCPQCGDYAIFYKTLSEATSKQFIFENKHLISGYLCEQRQLGITEQKILAIDDIKRIICSDIIPQTDDAKKIKILHYIYAAATHQEDIINLNPANVYLPDNDSLYYFLESLDNAGLVQNASTDGYYSASITQSGINYLME